MAHPLKPIDRTGGGSPRQHRRRLPALLLAAAMLLPGNAAGFRAFKGSEPAVPPPGGAVALPADSDHTGAAEVAAARVNGVAIPVSEVLRVMRQVALANYGGRQQLTPELAAKIKRDATERLVVEELVRQRSREAGITAEPEAVAANLERYKKRFHSPEEYAEHLAARQMTEADLAAQIADYLAAQELISREVEAVVAPVSEADLVTAYEVNKRRFTVSERAEVTDIVFFLDPAAVGARARADRLHRRLTDELAGDPAQLEPDGTFVVQTDRIIDPQEEPLLYQQARGLEAAAISAPFVAGGTLHIIKLTGYRPESTKSLDEVRDYLERELIRKRRGEKLEQWKASLLEGAEVEIFEIKVEP